MKGIASRLRDGIHSRSRACLVFGPAIFRLICVRIKGSRRLCGLCASGYAPLSSGRISAMEQWFSLVVWGGRRRLSSTVESAALTGLPPQARAAEKARSMDARETRGSPYPGKSSGISHNARREAMNLFLPPEHFVTTIAHFCRNDSM